MYNETICAIATGITNSGISIIRVSGENALSIVDSVFVNPLKKHTLSSKESHTVSYGFLLDGDEILDEVLVTYFKGPKSYTGEDTVEVNCHGGMYVTNKVLELIIKSGARLAQPGEFTKRAFLNGRIDLSKAEAVMDLISSESDMALKSSVSGLRGSIYEKIKDIRKKLIYEIAFIESALDDPEHISLDGYKDVLFKRINVIKESINNMISSYESGKVIKNGIRTVILGKPNVGKSSLLNALSGEDRAIVTDIAGTTRDIIEEKIRIGDVNIILVDTAGIRKTDDPVEKIGVDKALKSIDSAELIIFVIDSSIPLDSDDMDIIKIIKDRKSIIVYNKSDLEPKVDFENLTEYFDRNYIVSFSSVENKGIEALGNKIKNMFIQEGLNPSNEVIITSLRQKEALIESDVSLNHVIESIENDMPEDFYSIDLMSAYSYLGNIIGEELSDDLVNEIFSKFCMGK